MDANQSHDSSSSTTRRVVIEEPSAQLIDAVRAHVVLPEPDADGYWEVRGVRRIEADVQVTRVTHHRNEMTAEQPIIWDEQSTD